jgi:hypothetical protein
MYKVHLYQYKSLFNNVNHENQGSTIIFYGLFKGGVSNSDCIASNGRMAVSNELERMWKEVAITSFDCLHIRSLLH